MADHDLPCDCADCRCEAEVLRLREQLRIEQDARMQAERDVEEARDLVRLAEGSIAHPAGVLALRPVLRAAVKRWDAEEDIPFAEARTT